jgi:RNA polymerase sigma-70 factor (ECF subfamily)
MQKLERVDEFVSLYMQHSRRVYGFIRSLAPCQQDAEDIFQDVGRTLWEKFDQYQSGTSFIVWALSISHFKVLQHRRSESKRPLNLSDAVLELITRDLSHFSLQEDARFQVLNECVKKLPTQDRELVEFRYRQGQAIKTVASQLGRSADSIYRALRRIHKLLLTCIEQGMAKEELA